jgi:hypothetical protein
MTAQNTQVAAAGAAGARGSLATESPVCRKVKELIRDMRSDMYLAVRMDEFVKVLTEGGPITEEDVKQCLRYDDTVKVVRVKDKEVLWLWDGWRIHDLISRTAEVAAEEKEVLASP